MNNFKFPVLCNKLQSKLYLKYTICGFSNFKNVFNYGNYVIIFKFFFVYRTAIIDAFQRAQKKYYDKPL